MDNYGYYILEALYKTNGLLQEVLQELKEIKLTLKDFKENTNASE